jgi:hypothetical protein
MHLFTILDNKIMAAWFSKDVRITDLGDLIAYSQTASNSQRVSHQRKHAAMATKIQGKVSTSYSVLRSLLFTPIKSPERRIMLVVTCISLFTFTSLQPITNLVFT